MTARLVGPPGLPGRGRPGRPGQPGLQGATGLKKFKLLKAGNAKRSMITTLPRLVRDLAKLFYRPLTSFDVIFYDGICLGMIVLSCLACFFFA